MSEFSELLKKERIKKGISLRQMSKDLNVAISYLSDIEAGKKMAPNSKNEKYKDLLDNILNYLNLNSKERESITILADKDLINKGYVSNDLTTYMNETPMASVALRKAKEANITDKEWKRIIENLNK